MTGLDCPISCYFVVLVTLRNNACRRLSISAVPDRSGLGALGFIDNDPEAGCPHLFSNGEQRQRGPALWS